MSGADEDWPPESVLRRLFEDEPGSMAPEFRSTRLRFGIFNAEILQPARWSPADWLVWVDPQPAGLSADEVAWRKAAGGRLANRIGLSVVRHERPHRPSTASTSMGWLRHAHRTAVADPYHRSLTIVGHREAARDVLNFCIELRSFGAEMPTLQLLLCPALDDREDPASTWVSNEAPGTGTERGADLRGLPPTQILTVAGDLAGQAAFRLATRLRKSGVPTEIQLLMVPPSRRAAIWRSQRDWLLDTSGRRPSITWRLRYRPQQGRNRR